MKGIISYWYFCEFCLLISNDFRNDEYSEVIEGRICEGVCNICEKEVNMILSLLLIKRCLFMLMVFVLMVNEV